MRLYNVTLTVPSERVRSPTVPSERVGSSTAPSERVGVLVSGQVGPIRRDPAHDHAVPSVRVGDQFVERVGKQRVSCALYPGFVGLDTFEGRMKVQPKEKHDSCGRVSKPSNQTNSMPSSCSRDLCCGTISTTKDTVDLSGPRHGTALCASSVALRGSSTTSDFTTLTAEPFGLGASAAPFADY